MQSANTIWIDGEKIPDRRITTIFRQPPELPATLLKSSLIIGSRGVGKTTYFRFQEKVHPGLAIYMSLAEKLGPLARETSYGPLASDIPSDIEGYLIGKATSLLAIAIAEQFQSKGLTIPKRTRLAECLPETCVPPNRPIDDRWLNNIKKILIRTTDAEAFSGIAESRPLATFLAGLGQVAEQKKGPLLLLFDRADMVLPSALIPMIEILDQSRQYIAHVAMRPGHAGHTLARISEVIIPGDNYGVEYLGMHPRSEEWSDFVQAATKAQLNTKFNSIPTDIKDLIIAVSRDSLRTALELFTRYLSENGMLGRKELITAMEDEKEKLLLGAQTTLQKYHPNFRRLVQELRDQAIALDGRISGPLYLSIERSAPSSLFEELSQWDRFVDIALRCGALCMPEGHRWSPGLRPNQLEVPPLLLWNKDETFWTNKESTSIRDLNIKDKVLQSSGFAFKTPSIFVAYRMRSGESMQFLSDLKRSIKSHTKLHELIVEDGHVFEGVRWAEKIRERITKAKVVIGDITGLSSEVFFEMGFAYGLRKFEIRAVKDKSEVKDLPLWARDMQIGAYGNKQGITGLVRSIEMHLKNPEINKRRKPLQPIPHLAVWLRKLVWNKQACEQFEIISIRKDLECEVYDDDTSDEILIQMATKASLLVVSLDGTKSDALMHYICGSVIAKPKAGVSTKTLPRKILVIQDPINTGDPFVAESLRRCSHVVNVIELNQVREHTERFGASYQQWHEFQTPIKKRRQK